MRPSTPNSPTTPKEYIDSPHHPLRLNSADQRKKAVENQQRIPTSKTNNANFAFIQKMRAEIEDIVGMEVQREYEMDGVSPPRISELGVGGGVFEVHQPARTEKSIQFTDDSTVNSNISTLTHAVNKSHLKNNHTQNSILSSSASSINTWNSQGSNNQQVHTNKVNVVSRQQRRRPRQQDNKPSQVGRGKRISSHQKKKADIPILPAFFEIESYRRQLNDEIAELANHKKEQQEKKESNIHGFEDTDEEENNKVHHYQKMKITAIPQPIPEGGSSGFPGFYGVSYKRNPQRVPRSAIEFWSANVNDAPLIQTKGLGPLSFELPYQSDIQASRSNSTNNKKQINAVDNTSKPVVDGTMPISPLSMHSGSNSPIRTSPHEQTSTFGESTNSRSHRSTSHQVEEEEDKEDLNSFVISLGSNPSTPFNRSRQAHETHSSENSFGRNSSNFGASSSGIVGNVSDVSGRSKDFENLFKNQAEEESDELWENHFRSTLARPLAPSMLYLTHNPTNTAHLNIDPSTTAEKHTSSSNNEDFVCDDDVGVELARAMLQSQAAIVGGPDYEEVMLATASFRHKSPEAELLEIDLARKSLQNKDKHNEQIQKPIDDDDDDSYMKRKLDQSQQISCQLFAWSSEAHEAAWVIQRFVKKRQIRRNLCQRIIKYGYFNYIERRDFKLAMMNAKRLSGILMPIFKVYMVKIRKSLKEKRSSAILMQSSLRRWKAKRDTEEIRKQRILNAALVLTQTIRARLRLIRKRKRRDARNLVMILKLQTWFRGRIARKDFAAMSLAQKWFAATWRKFFERKYGGAVFRIQQVGRRFVLGLKARRIQQRCRIWLAYRIAKRKIQQAREMESERSTLESEYVDRAVRGALEQLADTQAGCGSTNGKGGDKNSGLNAKRRLDKILRIREKNIQTRHREAIRTVEAESKSKLKKLKQDGVLPDNKYKLRKEIRSLLTIAHQPLVIPKNKKKSTNQQKKKGQKKQVDDEPAENEILNIDEKSNFGSLFHFYDGPLRSKPPELSKNKKWNKTQLSKHKKQMLFYDNSVKLMKQALNGKGKKVKVGCCDIHFLRILVASFGCYDVDDEELLYVMQEFKPTLKSWPTLDHDKKTSNVINNNDDNVINDDDVNNDLKQDKKKEEEINNNLQINSLDEEKEEEKEEDDEDDEEKSKSNQIEEEKEEEDFIEQANQTNPIWNYSKNKRLEQEKKDKEAELVFKDLEYKNNVNSRGYVATDERLILGLSLLIHRHLNGEMKPKGIGGISVIGASRQVKAAWGKIGRAIPVVEGSITSKLTKSILPESKLFVQAARYEHLRITTDLAFAKSTELFRRRYPAKWFCPLCLEAFATYGEKARHITNKYCVLRAPAFGPDPNDNKDTVLKSKSKNIIGKVNKKKSPNERKMELWTLITEKSPLNSSSSSPNNIKTISSSPSNKTMVDTASNDSSSSMFSMFGSKSQTQLKTKNKSLGEKGGEKGANNTEELSGYDEEENEENNEDDDEEEEEEGKLVSQSGSTGYWDPSGGLNSKRVYYSGIPFKVDNYVLGSSS